MGAYYTELFFGQRVNLEQSSALDGLPVMLKEISRNKDGSSQLLLLFCEIETRWHYQ